MNKIKSIETERLILSAAKTVFTKYGLEGARTQDIANQAGINKALLHYYFRSKEKLFEKVFAEAIGEFFKTIKEVLNADTSLFEKIHAFAEGYINVITKNPQLPLFVLHEMNKHPDSFFSRFVNPGMFADVQKFMKQVRAEMKQGFIKPIDPLQLMMNINSLCIFPFLAKPLFIRMGNLDEPQWNKLIAQRKTAIAEFIIAAIKP